MTQNNTSRNKGPSGTVLVVDDDPRNRMLLHDLLKSKGYRITQAESGEEALDIIAADPPDTVLLDVMMTGMDGFEVCRRIKANPDTAHIPVLLVTALTGRDDRLAGIEAGGDDFITKPVDLKEVLLRTRNAVNMKQLRDQVRQSYIELEKMSKMRENLTNWLVHDMKAPLSGILGYLEMLQPKTTGGPLQVYVDEAYSATQRLHEMIIAVLDVSHLEQKQMPLDQKHEDLALIAADAVKHLAYETGEQKITVETAPGPAPAWCDRGITRRIIGNILGNAVKYTPQGGRIGIRFSQEAGQTRVEITDNGPGIAPRFHDVIFELFGQIEMRTAQKVYSHGLGLAFCKMAVEAQGGKIGVISDEGKGSTFWFTLPANPLETPA
ncbi:MAG: response regulator [Kiritimatiellia bacterium]